MARCSLTVCINSTRATSKWALTRASSVRRRAGIDLGRSRYWRPHSGQLGRTGHRCSACRRGEVPVAIVAASAPLCAAGLSTAGTAWLARCALAAADAPQRLDCDELARLGRGRDRRPLAAREPPGRKSRSPSWAHRSFSFLIYPPRCGRGRPPLLRHTRQGYPPDVSPPDG